jgi:hypothetical protein
MDESWHPQKHFPMSQRNERANKIDPKLTPFDSAGLSVAAP